MAGTDEQNFERFDLNRFPEEGGQRAQMALARRLCEEYADRFPETRYRNLLLTGAGDDAARPVCVCAEGSLVDRSRHFRPMLEELLNEYAAGRLGKHAVLRVSRETTLPGSAAAALLNR